MIGDTNSPPPSSHSLCLHRFESNIWDTCDSHYIYIYIYIYILFIIMLLNGQSICVTNILFDELRMEVATNFRNISDIITCHLKSMLGLFQTAKDKINIH